MINTMDGVQPFHEAYQQATGLNVILTMPKIYAWEAWMAHGWTIADLRMTVRYVKGKIRDGQNTMSALAFRNLIERPDWFDEFRAEAACAARVTKPHPAHSLASPHGNAVTERKTVEARSAGDVLAGMKALEEFRKLGASL